MTLQEIFINNLKKSRKERGVSQMELSKMCNTSSNYIGQIEMGRRIPSFDKIEQIAAALNIEPCRLFEYKTSTVIQEKQEGTSEYLKKMPASIKTEIISQLLHSIKKDIKASLDSQNY